MSQPRPPLPHHESSERSELGERNELSFPDANDDSALCPLLAEVTVFVVPGKLDLREVYERIDTLGGERVLDPAEATLVVTGLRGVPRLQRALGRNLHDRQIVSAGYIDSVYDVALAARDTDWRETGDVPPLPDKAPFLLRFKRPSVEGVSPPASPASPALPTSPAPVRHDRPGPEEADDGPRSKRPKLADPEQRTAREGDRDEDENAEKGDEKEDDEDEEGGVEASARAQLDDEKEEAAFVGPRVGPLPDVKPYPADIDFESIPRMAVLRPSPLVCVNQDIINAIKPIYTEREYDEGQQLNSNVLSYRRSMAILKSVPRRIRSGEEAQMLVDVGAKVANRINEYLATGQISESASIVASERFKALRLFSSVFTIGTHTAVQLWDAGCRTLDDVLEHYDWTPPSTPKEERKARKRRMEGTMTKAEIVHAWVRLREELDEPKDVAAISSLVRSHLHALRPDTQQVVAGGYRRGKQDTGDVDVIFTAGAFPSHPSPQTPDSDPSDGLIFRLVRRLCRLGIITHVLQLTMRARIGPLHSSGANFDNLDKAFVILKIGGKHRRVDLIASPRTRYAAAVLSWSGSMMFERDLRRYIEDRGLKFRAGLIDPHTQREINFATERELFAFLELPYVPPRLRNADG